MTIIFLMLDVQKGHFGALERALLLKTAQGLEHAPFDRGLEPARSGKTLSASSPMEIHLETY